MGKFVSEHVDVGGTFIEDIYPELTMERGFVGSLAPPRVNYFRFKVSIVKYPNDKKYLVRYWEWSDKFNNYVQMDSFSRKKLSVCRRRAERWLTRKRRHYGGWIKI